MKKCRSCKKEIDSKAKKCPHCQDKQGNWLKRHPILTGIIGFIVLIMVVSASGGDTSSSQPSTSKPSTEMEMVDTNGETVEVEETSNETVSQKNAVRKAKSYLSISGYSRSGLIKQLEFEKFSTEDATYAVDAVGADWNEQASKKAKSYLDISGYSRDSLITQLEFEGFTTEQATYGVDAVGL